MIFKPYIFSGFSENLTKRDVKIAVKNLFKFRNLFVNKKKYRLEAETKLKKYFNIENVFLVDSGRSGLYLALKVLGIKPGDYVGVQAFTCLVVINAIKKIGAKPLYIDINETFNLDLQDLEKKIKKNPIKVLLVQYTFGLPVKVDKIKQLAQKHNFKVIEDLAHAVGLKIDYKLTGTIFDIGVLSFGSDKIISCNRGGALITKNQDLGKKIKQIYNQLPETPWWVVRRHLYHYPIFYLGKKLYHWFGLGKFILYLARNLNLINYILRPEEKQNGILPKYFPAKLHNALAEILSEQISEIDKINQHRRELANFYLSSIYNPKIKINIPKTNGFLNRALFLRFPILVDRPDKMRRSAKKQHIILGDWYNQVVAPNTINMNLTDYQHGSCPHAEMYCRQIVNLPTHRNINLKQAQIIINFLNSYENNQN